MSDTSQSSQNSGGSGISASDRVAITALVVSLVALLTTIGQLLQQYFATADGYRRCQSSVMGDWAQKTRLRWRWRQFRFETLYTIPEISMTSDGIARERAIMILGDKMSRKLTLTPHQAEYIASKTSSEKDVLLTTDGRTLVQNLFHPNNSAHSTPIEANGDMVSWLSFLHWTHEVTRTALESKALPHPSLPGESTPDSLLRWRRVPTLVMCERSWDLQPPDVIRPVAKTTVAVIAILARRMGMRWKDFRPEDGVLRAEGHSHVLTSTIVRGLGLVLQYDYTGRGQRLSRASRWRTAALTGSIYKEEEEVYIATSNADRLGAGVIRGHQRLRIPSFSVNSKEDIIEAMQILRFDDAAPMLRKLLREVPDFRFPVGDLVAMVSPMIWQGDSPLIQIPAPSDNCGGMTRSAEGRISFASGLGSYIEERNGPLEEIESIDWTEAKVGKWTCWVYWKMGELSRNWNEWGSSDFSRDWKVRQRVDYMQALRVLFDEVMGFFCSSDPGPTSTGPQQHPFNYLEVLKSHVLTNLLRFQEYEYRGWTQWTTENYSAIASKMDESSSLQVDNCFKSLDELMMCFQLENKELEKDLVDAWVMMMFRAFLWGACHYFVPGPRVPMAYFGSQLPVYIG